MSELSRATDGFGHRHGATRVERLVHNETPGFTHAPRGQHKNVCRQIAGRQLGLIHKSCERGWMDKCLRLLLELEFHLAAADEEEMKRRAARRFESFACPQQKFGILFGNEFATEADNAVAVRNVMPVANL